jgi:hypothetical protein
VIGRDGKSEVQETVRILSLWSNFRGNLRLDRVLRLL